MVEAVARHGYAGTTLRELVGLAGVSKTTFYVHFASKEDCFLSTFDEIVVILEVRVAEAYRSGGDFHQRLLAALRAFMDLAVEEPAAASLTAVESLTLGAAGVAHRERASAAFEELVQQSFDHSPSEHEVSPETVRAIVAGIRGVAYRRLRAGHPEDLPELCEVLVDWALSYQRAESEPVARAAAAAAVPIRSNPSPRTPRSHPGRSRPTARSVGPTLTQRERIVRAAALVVVERGYEALRIPTISAAAGTSNQTFYEHFTSKRDAFLGAFEIVAAEALTFAVAAFAGRARRTGGDRRRPAGALRVHRRHMRSSPGSPSSSCRPPGRRRSTAPTRSWTPSRLSSSPGRRRAGSAGRSPRRCWRRSAAASGR